MGVFRCFPVLACVEVSVVWDVLTHLVSGLNEVVAQVAIAGLGHAPVFGLEVTGGGTGPPEASDFGHGVFGVAQITGAVAFAPLIPR